jgi:hypothetical protein
LKLFKPFISFYSYSSSAQLFSYLYLKQATYLIDGCENEIDVGLSAGDIGLDRVDYAEGVNERVNFVVEKISVLVQ